MPTVTAIITTLNRPTELLRAISSVLNQSYCDLEVVVVVDGPHAPTEQILQTVKDQRLRVVVNPENVGLAEARNVGVRVAKGEWVAFLDDDDEWMPRKLELQVKEAQRFGSHEVLVVGRYLERMNSIERIWPETLPFTRERFSEYLFLKRGQLLPSTYFVSASLVKRIPFTRGLRHIEDLDWLLRLAANPDLRIGGVEEPVAVYNNFNVAGRESRDVPWQVFYVWAVSRRELFTPIAFSLFLVKSVVPWAREAGTPLRERFHILSAALLLGACRPKVLFFFFASAFFSRETKRKMRELVSPSARRARISQPAD